MHRADLLHGRCEEYIFGCFGCNLIDRCFPPFCELFRENGNFCALSTWKNADCTSYCPAQTGMDLQNKVRGVMHALHIILGITPFSNSFSTPCFVEPVVVNPVGHFFLCCSFPFSVSWFRYDSFVACETQTVETSANPVFTLIRCDSRGWARISFSSWYTSEIILTSNTVTVNQSLLGSVTAALAVSSFLGKRCNCSWIIPKEWFNSTTWKCLLWFNEVSVEHGSTHVTQWQLWIRNTQCYPVCSRFPLFAPWLERCIKVTVTKSRLANCVIVIITGSFQPWDVCLYQVSCATWNNFDW